MSNKKHALLLAAFILVSILIFDQSLKIWVLKHMLLGDTKPMLGNWFSLHFTENNGMAFGVELGGVVGKLILTVFRLVAVIGIVWYLLKQIKLQAPLGLIACISLILAGAIGNIIDSVFYGVVFEDYVYYAEKGKFFLGRVVDMLYFPVVEGTYPSWFPIWSGEKLTFFSPVFNIADASISTGVIAIIVFQKRFFGKKLEEPLMDDDTHNLKEETFTNQDSSEENNIKKSDELSERI